MGQIRINLNTSAEIRKYTDFLIEHDECIKMFTKYGYSTLGMIAIIVFILFYLSFFIQNNYLK